MRIELFSTDCVKCRRLEFNLQQALGESGVEGEVVKVKDIDEMQRRGIRSIPALAIDGVVKFVGVVPRVEELRELIIESARKKGSGPDQEK